MVAVKRWYKSGLLPNHQMYRFVLRLKRQFKGCGSKWQDSARKQLHVTASSPFLLPSLGTATFTYPSLLTRAVSLSPDWSRCQRSSEHKGSGGSWRRLRLNIPSPALQICLSHFVFSASHERETSEKTPPIERGGKLGGYSIYLQGPGVCL